MKNPNCLEEIFVSSLGSNARLKWHLQYKINLVEYLDNYWSNYMNLADMSLAFMTKKKIVEMFDDISSKRILKILERERLDLYKTINTKNGLLWIEEQIENFRRRFL